MKRSNRVTPVILNEDVEGIGFAGELVKTKPGFARNFLLPRRLASVATPKLQAEREKEIARAADKRASEVAAREDTAKTLASETIRLELKVGPGGRVFGAITAAEFATAVKQQRKIEIDAKRLHGVPLGGLGTHTVSAKLGLGVVAQLPVQVAGQSVKSEPDKPSARPKAKTTTR